MSVERTKSVNLETPRIERRLLALVTEQGAMSQTEIHRRFGNNLSADRLWRAIDVLVASGQVESTESKSSSKAGRPKLIVSLPGSAPAGAGLAQRTWPRGNLEKGILELVAKQGEVRHTDLHRRFGNHLSAGQLRQAIDSLVASGQLKSTKNPAGPNGGRPTIIISVSPDCQI